MNEQKVVPKDVPTVDYVLDVGYALHASDDQSLSGTETQINARRVVARFRALEIAPDDERYDYFQVVNGIIVSHARGLSRRKAAWFKELQAALDQRNKREERTREVRRSNTHMNAIWKLLSFLAVGTAGYLLGEILSVWIPREIAEQTGTRMPSILLGVASIFLSRSIRFWIYDAERKRAEMEYRSRCYNADLAYEYGKLTEYKLYRARLCEAWKRYMGEEYPETVSYQVIMAGDLETRERLEHQLQRHNRSALWRLKRVCQFVLRIRKKKRTP